MASFEVGLDNGSESLLPRGVPDVELDELVIVGDIFHLEVDGGDSLFPEAQELPLSVLPEDRGFAHAGIPNDNEFESLLLAK